MKRIIYRIGLALAMFFMANGSFGQTVGEVLPAWETGLLDLHHINTGRGNAAFFILPDGTTMVLDAGAMNSGDARSHSPRTTQARPDTTRTPGEWISRYIEHMIKSTGRATIDYAVLTHFHNDHMGSVNPTCKTANNGAYQLSGLTEVGDRIPIRVLLDRGWPDYDYPAPMGHGMMQNYRAFIKWQAENRQLRIERFKPGRNDQIVLQHKPKAYPEFEIRNLAANGEVWTGVAANTRQLFPSLKDMPAEERPGENDCSIALRLSYGSFDYFNGSDIGGGLEPGAPAWLDVETPVAQVVGPVEVNVLNHHGNKSSENENLVRMLRPQVDIIQVWSSNHPGECVLERLQSTRLYPGPRDIFATNMIEANKIVIGPNLGKLKSDQGHILVRVDKGGKTYRVIILDDSAESYKVTAVHGPYTCE